MALNELFGGQSGFVISMLRRTTQRNGCVRANRRLQRNPFGNRLTTQSGGRTILVPIGIDTLTATLRERQSLISGDDKVHESR